MMRQRLACKHRKNILKDQQGGRQHEGDRGISMAARFPALATNTLPLLAALQQFAWRVLALQVVTFESFRAVATGGIT